MREPEDVRAISFTGSVAGRPAPSGTRRRRATAAYSSSSAARTRCRDGRRGARPGRRGRLCRRVLVGRSEVHRDAPHPRPGRRLRRFPGAAARPDRSGRRSAIPPIPTSRSGRVVNEGALEDILAAIDRVARQATEPLACGRRARERRRLPDRAASSRGLADDAELSCEEVFGPVASLYPSSTPSTRRSGARTPFASASPPRSSPATCTRCSGSRRRSKRRVVHVNSQTAGADVHVPFGGVKESGWGPHEQGRAALEFYTETVTVYQDAPFA